MAHALALDSRDIALDLHGLLKDLDPARWRDGLEAAVRERLDELQARITGLEEQFDDLRETCTDETQAVVTETLTALDERFASLSELVREYAPADGLPMPDLRKEWMTFRARLQPAYEGLADGLRLVDIHVPSLRPTNYARNVFHVAMALMCLVLVEMVLPVAWMRLAALCVAASAWLMELGKRRNARVDRLTWQVLGKMGHPYERRRINSATWFSTGLFTLSLTGSHLVCALSLAVLGLADPAAGLVGRRWGRIKLVRGRSLEGTTAFVVAGTVACLATLGIWHASLGWPLALGLTASAVLPAAFAELYSRRIDDNLLVPMAAAAGAAAFAMIAGILL